MSKTKQGLIAVIRIRGQVDQPKNVKHGLSLLNLNRSMNAVVVPNDPTHVGMMQQLKDAVTWGEIDKKTLTALIKKRGRIIGNKKIDIKYLKEQKFDTMTAFITAIYDGKADMRKIDGLKPLFRLHPPRKGFKSVKNPITRGGDLGYRGDKINALLMRML